MASEGRSDAPSDLTARARIRDAALEQFAEHGAKGATMRGIAEVAGVSLGLVQHHYGSKRALREACDTYAIEAVKRTKERALADGADVDDPGFLSTLLSSALPIQRYVGRALVDGSSGAAKLFDDLVAYTEGYLGGDVPGVAPARTDDPRGYAAALTAMSLGVLVLREHLSRVLGVDTATAEGYPRLGMAMLDVLTDDLLDPELAAKARAGYERWYRAAGPTGSVDPENDGMSPGEAAARKADSDPPTPAAGQAG